VLVSLFSINLSGFYKRTKWSVLLHILYFLQKCYKFLIPNTLCNDASEGFCNRYSLVVNQDPSVLKKKKILLESCLPSGY
jgi:hypothetical protein